jgi:hypothetical protein
LHNCIISGYVIIELFAGFNKTDVYSYPLLQPVLLDNLFNGLEMKFACFVFLYTDICVARIQTAVTYKGRFNINETIIVCNI